MLYLCRRKSFKKREMDIDIFSTDKARLTVSSLEELRGEQTITDYGAIIICRQGSATMRIDFKSWQLGVGDVITIFPNDVVAIEAPTDDFSVEMLRYDPAMLREASLQLERTVYSKLRNDRCRQGKQVVADIINAMFALLRIYFDQPECKCLDQLVLYQLKAFFIGFYDYITRKENAATTDKSATPRTNDLFNQFMELLESDYKLSHDVAYFAQSLCITPKYLSTIVKRITSHTPKTIIDHYVTLQLKLSLRNTDKAVKQIAWDYHFSDASFFCRYFKQHTGTSPQEFRRTLIHNS